MVAMIDDEATVKRVYFEGDRVRFQPSNPRMAPIYVRESRLQEHHDPGRGGGRLPQDDVTGEALAPSRYRLRLLRPFVKVGRRPAGLVAARLTSSSPACT